MKSRKKINYLKNLANNFKIISRLRKEFDLYVGDNIIDIHLKKEYNDSDDYKYIIICGEDMIVALSDVKKSLFDKRINLYIGNTVVNGIKGIYKLKNITILTDDVPVFLEDFNYINYEDVCINTDGKLKIGAVDIKNDLIVKAKEIEVNSDSDVNSKNQYYTATTMNVKYGFLDATSEIKMQCKNLIFHRSGVFAKKLSINSEDVLFSNLKSFNLDNFEINSDIIDSDDSIIIAKNYSISSDNQDKINIKTDSELGDNQNKNNQILSKYQQVRKVKLKKRNT